METRSVLIDITGDIMINSCMPALRHVPGKRLLPAIDLSFFKCLFYPDVQKSGRVFGSYHISSLQRYSRPPAGLR